jgi:hypothetical protein
MQIMQISDASTFLILLAYKLLLFVIGYHQPNKKIDLQGWLASQIW